MPAADPPVPQTLPQQVPGPPQSRHAGDATAGSNASVGEPDAAAVAGATWDHNIGTGTITLTLGTTYEHLFAPAADGTRIFGIDWFLSQRAGLSRHYSQHNIALKYLRESCEQSGVHECVLDNYTPKRIPEINHPAGMHHTWMGDYARSWTWRWQDMVAQMANESMAWVVLGPERRSRGIVCCILFESNEYDHKRHYALKQLDEAAAAETKLYEWSFIFVRDDGSFASLRPAYKNNKIQHTDVPMRQAEGGIPASGKGGTSGKGTYKYYKEKNVTKTLKFDGSLMITQAAQQPQQPPP